MGGVGPRHLARHGDVRRACGGAGRTVGGDAAEPAGWPAVGYLALAVTAAAFVLWYSSVRRLGASRAGLLTGIAPVAAAATGILFGGAAPSPLGSAGIAVVAAGLAFGFREGKD